MHFDKLNLEGLDKENPIRNEISLLLILKIITFIIIVNEEKNLIKQQELKTIIGKTNSTFVRFSWPTLPKIKVPF